MPKSFPSIQRIRPLMFLHRARGDSANYFYRRNRCLPVLSGEGEALKIAIPQELAPETPKP